MNIPRIATLRDTQNYIRSLDAGLTLFDLPPGRVAQDLADWQPLMEWTGLFELEDEELLAMFDQLDAHQITQSALLSLDALHAGHAEYELDGEAAYMELDEMLLAEY
jgi:hypothetical protein